jgi:hypothetical protein
VYSILFLIAIIAPAVGTYTFLQVQKAHVKRAIKRKMIAGINRDELVHLKFSAAEHNNLLRWEHEREFEYNGEMYDVVAREWCGDSVQYWAWWDYEETQLNRQLKQLVKGHLSKDKTTKENAERLFEFMKLLYCQDNALLLLEQYNLDNSCFINKRKFPPNRYLEPPKPPPQSPSV